MALLVTAFDYSKRFTGELQDLILKRIAEHRDIDRAPR